MEVSSLGELGLVGAEHRLLQAQAAALESLDDIKETSRVLRERTYEIRARLPRGQTFVADPPQPHLPRTVPLLPMLSAF